MKKIISLSLVLTLLMGILAVPAMAEEAACGVLSYLNISEEEDSQLTIVHQHSMKILYLHGVLEGEGNWHSGGEITFHYYDTMNDLLMALQAGKVGTIKVPYYTGKYLCSTNDSLKMKSEYHPEKATTVVAAQGINMISDGYSFMLKKDNTELRDAFDAQIKAMKEDGTLQKLIDEHIVKVAEGGEPVAIAFEKFEGDPIKIAVTGSLPPMDYVAPDGTFAGFNTAVLAEIGKRLQKNIELVQVDSVGRALALSEGTVDVVFWTRAMSESRAAVHANGELSEEELAARRAKSREAMTEEEKAIFTENASPYQDKDKSKLYDDLAKLAARDMPADTIITQPYFTDFPVLVTLK